MEVRMDFSPQRYMEVLFQDQYWSHSRVAQFRRFEHIVARIEKRHAFRAELKSRSCILDRKVCSYVHDAIHRRRERHWVRWVERELREDVALLAQTEGLLGEYGVSMNDVVLAEHIGDATGEYWAANETRNRELRAFYQNSRDLPAVCAGMTSDAPASEFSITLGPVADAFIDGVVRGIARVHRIVAIHHDDDPVDLDGLSDLIKSIR